MHHMGQSSTLQTWVSRIHDCSNAFFFFAMFLSLTQLRLRIKQRTIVLATLSVIFGVGRRGSLLQPNGQKSV